jgi:hypothetical protein
MTPEWPIADAIHDGAFRVAVNSLPMLSAGAAKGGCRVLDQKRLGIQVPMRTPVVVSRTSNDNERRRQFNDCTFDNVKRLRRQPRMDFNFCVIASQRIRKLRARCNHDIGLKNNPF